MATTQLTTCDREGCKAVKSPRNEKEWIAAGLTEDGIVFGSQMSIQVQTVADYCSPDCSIKATMSIMGWKKPGRPKGSKNKPKEQTA